MKAIIHPWICTRCASSISRIARLSNLPTAPNVTQQRRTHATKPHPQDGRPFRMAVIGSGPAGFYTSYKVMSKVANSVVDMYEHLPVPFGLVRFGVAPDHPEVKNCQDKFQEVAESPRFNFIGNISVGNLTPTSLPLASLLPHYDAVLFAYGASKDKKLGIANEDTLKGIHSARAFVGWYNGLPEYADLAPDLTLGEEAIVVGQGNVALDVARILLQDPDVLRKTDITEDAIETLSKSRVNRVRVVGRRGAMQAAFTIKEVRELINLENVGFHPILPNLIPDDISILPRAPKRLMEVLNRSSKADVKTAPKSWSLDFCLSPTSFNPTMWSSRLGSMTFEGTYLHPNAFDQKAQAVGTGQAITLDASLAFRSIGYKSEALSEFSELNIPFDGEKGIIPNDALGRVVQSKEGEDNVCHIPGLYCAGWAKRGPTGVIASTMEDAFSTAESISRDWYEHTPFLNAGRSSGLGWEGVRDEAENRGCRRVSWQDWKTIDAVERKRGMENGKEREKFTRVEDMLAILG